MQAATHVTDRQTCAKSLCVVTLAERGLCALQLSSARLRVGEVRLAKAQRLVVEGWLDPLVGGVHGKEDAVGADLGGRVADLLRTMGDDEAVMPSKLPGRAGREGGLDAPAFRQRDSNAGLT